MGEEIFIVDIENAELMEKIKSEGLGDPCFIDKFQKDNPTKVDKVRAIKAMSQAEKANLRYQYILANTTAAQGDFADTSDRMCVA